MNIELLIDLAVKMVFVIASGVVSLCVIPWLKAKRLYDTVKKMVNAAEKWAQTRKLRFRILTPCLTPYIMQK